MWWRHASVAIGGLLALYAAAATAAEAAVEVFTLSTLPLTNPRDASVYYVDAVELLQQHLSSGLPPDRKRAQEMVAQRMAALGPQLETRARAGTTGLSRAAQLGVQRAPAIVFDGRWAVYGLTDVDAARRIFASRAARERK